MIRRLIFLCGLAYAVIALRKLAATPVKGPSQDYLARADWEAEGGRPLSADAKAAAG